MSVPRYAARADANKKVLIEYFELIGGVWANTREPFDGFAGYAGVWTPVELKSPGGKFTEQQKKFVARIGPHGLPHWVWTSIDDIRWCVGNLKPEGAR